MITMNLLDDLYEEVLEGEYERTPDLTRRCLDAGYAPQFIIDEAMIPAMSEAGRLFEDDLYFVPELLTSGRAIKSALDVLRPLLSTGSAKHAGRVVIGTVQGDLHDIGKNLVAVMLEGAGFEIVDLGIDVSPADFVDAIRATVGRVVSAAHDDDARDAADHRGDRCRRSAQRGRHPRGRSAVERAHCQGIRRRRIRRERQRRCATCARARRRPVHPLTPPVDRQGA
jgi:hypothetical protein